MTTSRSLFLGAAAVAFAATLCAFPASAASDKTLQNMKGSVTYGVTSSPRNPLALMSTVTLNDGDSAATGPESLATIGLPDSSRVLIGANSNVQLAAFNTSDIAHARFVMVGKVRFVVQHPAGAKADYTFTTATGQVSVRGTEGDIDAQPGGVTVNVYELCDPSTPVTVTTSNGQVFRLVAGQSLVAQIVNGILQAKVEQLTQGLIDQFSPDFGVPTSWDAAKGEIVSTAQSQASSAIDNATGGYGSQVTSAVSSLFGHKKSTPTPSPSPGTTSCAH
jgi:hypothetical protein